MIDPWTIRDGKSEWDHWPTRGTSSKMWIKLSILIYTRPPLDRRYHQLGWQRISLPTIRARWGELEVRNSTIMEFGWAMTFSTRLLPECDGQSRLTHVLHVGALTLPTRIRRGLRGNFGRWDCSSTILPVSRWQIVGKLLGSHCGLYPWDFVVESGGTLGGMWLRLRPLEFHELIKILWSHRTRTLFCEEIWRIVFVEVDTIQCIWCLCKKSWQRNSMGQISKVKSHHGKHECIIIMFNHYTL